jgi:hypothetical protein
MRFKIQVNAKTTAAHENVIGILDSLVLQYIASRHVVINSNMFSSQYKHPLVNLSSRRTQNFAASNTHDISHKIETELGFCRTVFSELVRQIIIQFKQVLFTIREHLLANKGTQNHPLLHQTDTR